MALTKVDISMLEDIPAPGSSGQVIKSDGSAWTSAVLAAGGDSRNFMIDGDFTQWPEGYAATTNSSWKSALWFGRPDIGTVEFSRSTDVPTAAQSGHTSAYSFKVDCTATGSLASGTKLKLYYWMSGHDYAHLHRQPFVFSFWVKSYQTGTHTCGFQNSNGTRTYIAEYTVTASATWERKTIAVPAESSDTGWLFTEADKGLGVIFGLAVGSAQQTAAGSWTAGNYNGSSNTQNITSSTNNYINIAQLMLTRGTTAPSVFLGEPISTVKEQVGYYYRHTWDDGVAIGTATNTGSVFHVESAAAATPIIIKSVNWGTRMRDNPTITLYDISTNSGKVTYYNGTTPAHNKTGTADAIGTTGFRIYTDASTSKNGVNFHYIASARH